MIGRTLVRWLASSGSPAALRSAEPEQISLDAESTDLVDDVQQTYIGDNWVARLIQRNRVLTASGIAVVLFTFGGFAWSARNEPRLVRKVTQPAPEMIDSFDELTKLPSYKAKKQQLPESDMMIHSAPPLEVSPPAPTVPGFDPCEELEPPDAETLQPFGDPSPSPSTEQFTAPSFDHSPGLAAPDDSAVAFPDLGLPDLDASPQLDPEPAAPLLESGNPFQSR